MLYIIINILDNYHFSSKLIPHSKCVNSLIDLEFALPSESEISGNIFSVALVCKKIHTFARQLVSF